MKVERPKSLTVASLATYRADTHRRLISDPATQSLYLMVGARPRGTKSWVMRFRRPDGRPGKMTIGRYDASGREPKDDLEPGQPLSLVGAREVAARVHRQRARGEDVIANFKAKKRRHKTAAADHASNTFSAAVHAYIAGYVKKKTKQRPRGMRATARLLGLGLASDGGEPEVITGSLVERWADRPVREIDGHDIHTVIDEARDSRIPGIKPANKGPSEARARLLFVALSSLFSWLLRQRSIDVHPLKSVSVPLSALSRDRFLNDAEIKKFWLACGKIGQPYEGIFKTLLATGARLNEVARMTRGELSADGTMWSLPGQRTKNGLPLDIPLSPLVREIIASLPPQNVESDYAFALNGKPVTHWSDAKRRLDALMKVPAWRLHDLRRSFVTGAIELGIAPHVIEAVVNHVSGHRSGVAGTYNKATLMPERREALARWAAHIEGLTSEQPESKIVPIKGGGRG